MTFEEALIIHIIKNKYTLPKAASTLAAFNVELVGRYQPLAYKFTDYIRTLGFISNEGVMHIVMASHYLSSQTQDSQAFILNYIMKDN